MFENEMLNKVMEDAPGTTNEVSTKSIILECLNKTKYIT